jgi:hypothetical protein
MPFDFAELSVQDMLHIDAQCAAVDLKILPTNEKLFSLPLSVESTEVTIELGTGGPEPKMELSTQNDRVIAVDFVRMPPATTWPSSRALALLSRL